MSRLEQMSDCKLLGGLLEGVLACSILTTGVNETRSRCRFKFESIVRENADGRGRARTGILEPEMGMQTSQTSLLPESH